MKTLHIIKNILVSSFLCVSIFGQIGNAQVHFEPKQEFPNYFSAISRQDLEKALGAVFDRLEVPIADASGVRLVRYFSYIKQELAAIDPHVKAMPSGGIIRSALSFLYVQIYEEIKRNPGKNVLEIVNSFARGSSGIPLYLIRGVGSDLDILLENVSTEKVAQVQNRLTEITNSFEVSLGGRDMQGVFRRVLFAKSDIKEYQKQISEAVAEGGSTLDWLAFDLENNRIVEPAGHEYIVQLLLHGKYRYVSGEPRDAGKQTVRGLRALLELPFISIEDDTVIKKELNDVITGATKLTDRALEQFEKMVRNARFGAANNRFRRGIPGSLESIIIPYLKNIEKTYKIKTVPEFVDSLKIGRAALSIPSDLLIPFDKFLVNHTANGLVFHGTPDLASGLSIMRSGLVISGGELRQGVAAHGRGAYTTSNRRTAEGYFKGTGLIFEIPIVRDPNIIILDAKRAKNHPFIKSVLEKFPGEDLHEILATRYGVDIIADGHVLIQNMNVLQIPNRMLDLAKALEEYVYNRSVEARRLDERIRALKEYRLLYTYTALLENTHLREPPSALPLVRDVVNSQGRMIFIDFRSRLSNELFLLIKMLNKNELSELKNINFQIFFDAMIEKNLRSDRLTDDRRISWAIDKTKDIITDLSNLNNLLKNEGVNFSVPVAAVQKAIQFFETTVSHREIDRATVPFIEICLAGTDLTGDKAYFEKAVATAEKAIAKLGGLKPSFDSSTVVNDLALVIERLGNQHLKQKFETEVLALVFKANYFSFERFLRSGNYKLTDSSKQFIRHIYDQSVAQFWDFPKTDSGRIANRLMRSVDPSWEEKKRIARLEQRTKQREISDNRLQNCRDRLQSILTSKKKE